MKVSSETALPRVVPIKKQDDEQHLVFGEVYAPDVPDSQGDWMTAETIRDMAYRFLKNGYQHNVDLNHTREQCGAYIVESFIAREGDDVFIPGAWVIGVHIPDDEVWTLVKTGELNGFSLDGIGLRVPTTLEIEVPEVLKGETDEVSGHKHIFYVQFDDDGSFIGGYTSKADDGHYHVIKRGTVTEEVNGHSHRFSFVEGIINAKA